ncbi:MAG TPA: helix-turn-helix domain-containing protein [Acetobacteraceae bacterium]|jgi:CRP-like cAMP-binding protein|nr:helix-turn-helix domain-containing protein [Acetobacteraceae bacterium]
MLALLSDASTGSAAVSFGGAKLPLKASFPQPACACVNTVPTPGHILDALAPMAKKLQFGRGDEIIAQGDPAEYCIQVVSGCVRTVQLLEDGRRQVGAFLLPGDVFGWEALGEHAFAAEAVTPVTLRRFRLAAIDERADNDRTFAQKLRRHIAEQIRITRGHLTLLGRLTASERIAAFLLEMSDRLRGPGKSTIELPMCRADMADYLCLTIETVSRGLTELRQSGAIGVERSHIAIHDRRALSLTGFGRLH